MCVFCFKGLLRARLHGEGEVWEVAVRRGAGFSDRACGGGPLQKETQAECLLREPWGTFDVGGLRTSLQMALRGDGRSERTGASHLQVKPEGWLGARSCVCISSPPGPPWSVCLDSYGIKCSVVTEWEFGQPQV